MSISRRIIVLCDYFSDYSENRASYYVRYHTSVAFSKRGHQVLFIYISNGTKLIKKIVEKNFVVIGTPGIFPQRFRTGGFGLIDCLCKLFLIIKYKPEIVYVVTGHRPSNLFPCLLAKYFLGSTIVDERWEWLGKGGYAEQRKSFIGQIISFYDNLLDVRCEKFFDATIVISSALKKRFKFQDDVYVLPGGADNENLKPYELQFARKELDLPEGKFILGASNLSRGDHVDNEPFFLALNHLCEENGCLTLLATGMETDYVREIEKKYNLEGRIISLGYVSFSDYNLYLSACNAFVLAYPDTPINRGRWPNKFGDYLCLRRPIITNPTGDLERFFMQFKIGLLCDPSPEGFSRAIKTLLENRNKIGDYTFDSDFVVKEYFSFERRVDKILNIFSEAINDTANTKA